MNTILKNQTIALVIPCFNESVTIGKVIKDFRIILEKNNHNYTIYVYNNNSTDQTAEIALKYGAIVRNVTKQGKGHVLRKAFSDINADILLIVDGDDTYDPNTAGDLIRHIENGDSDMTIANRKSVHRTAYRLGHKTGNKLLTKSVNIIFGNDVNDMLSGYRALSKKFYKSIPVTSKGFEIETEISIQALKMQIDIIEIQSYYKERPALSYSKLSTFSDGWNILILIFNLFRQDKPFLFFGLISFLCFLIFASLFLPIITIFLETGEVLKFPTLIVSIGVLVISILSFYTGLILDNVTKGRNENKMLFFLNNKQEK